MCPSARKAVVLRTAERRSESGLERVEFRECSNWIRKTEGKAAGETGRRNGEKKDEKQKNGLNEMRHSLFSGHYKVCFAVGDSRKNNEDRVILSTSIMLSKTHC